MEDASQVFVGFDGFVDAVIHPVHRRLSRSRFCQFPTLKAFAQKIAAASHKNANIELVVAATHLGGNAPILSTALAHLGYPSTLVGCCGYPILNDLFEPLERLKIRILSFANPGFTDAIECSDGKLLLGKMNGINELCLNDLLQRLSPSLFKASIEKAHIIAAVNWTMMPLVEEFFLYLLSNKKLLKASSRKQLFVDLADPAKRTKKDLHHCLKLLSMLNTFTDVTLGLNKAESQQVASALKLPASSILHNAENIAAALKIHTVIIHSSSETAVCSGPFSTSIHVPFCKKPVRTTGAGDTFNAGYISGLIEDDPIVRRLQKGIAASNVWIRTGLRPTMESAKAFIAEHL
jgi:hypothetical protein